MEAEEGAEGKKDGERINSDRDGPRKSCMEKRSQHATAINKKTGREGIGEKKTGKIDAPDALDQAVKNSGISLTEWGRK